MDLSFLRRLFLREPRRQQIARISVSVPAFRQFTGRMFPALERSKFLKQCFCFDFPRKIVSSSTLPLMPPSPNLSPPTTMPCSEDKLFPFSFGKPAKFLMSPIPTRARHKCSILVIVRPSAWWVYSLLSEARGRNYLHNRTVASLAAVVASPPPPQSVLDVRFFGEAVTSRIIEKLFTHSLRWAGS